MAQQRQSIVSPAGWAILLAMSIAVGTPTVSHALTHLSDWSSGIATYVLNILTLTMHHSTGRGHAHRVLLACRLSVMGGRLLVSHDLEVNSK
jgi:hypothetical protein